MSLKQQIDDQLKQAMRDKNESAMVALRMLKTAVKNWEVAQMKEAGDEQIVSVIQSQVKQRKDSAAQFRDAGRAELAEKEEKEISVLATFLPEQLSEEEVRALVDEAVASTGAASAKDMGKVMGALMPNVKGKADGSLVNRLVKEKLGS